jgi:hypothetical protein
MRASRGPETIISLRDQSSPTRPASFASFSDALTARALAGDGSGKQSIGVSTGRPTGRSVDPCYVPNPDASTSLGEIHPPPWILGTEPRGRGRVSAGSEDQEKTARRHPAQRHSPPTSRPMAGTRAPQPPKLRAQKIRPGGRRSRPISPRFGSNRTLVREKGPGFIGQRRPWVIGQGEASASAARTRSIRSSGNPAEDRCTRQPGRR